MHKLKVLRNTVIRQIVNVLIGNNLVVEITETLDGTTIELVDLCRRLPYGKRKIVSEEKRMFDNQTVKSVTSFTILKE